MKVTVFFCHHLDRIRRIEPLVKFLQRPVRLRWDCLSSFFMFPLSWCVERWHNVSGTVQGGTWLEPAQRMSALLLFPWGVEGF